MTTATAARTPYRVKADSVEACSCQHGCNCQFAGFPNEGICDLIIGYKVTDGRVGDVDLAGVQFVIAGKYPNAIHEGNGHIVLFVDEAASAAQADAVASILSGQLGGMPWEALAGTVATFEGPIRRPVTITANGERSSVQVADAIDLKLTPLTDPVTGEDKQVHIVYPKGGFFWNDAAVATTSTMKATHGAFSLEWPGRYASVAAVSWTNQA